MHDIIALQELLDYFEENSFNIKLVMALFTYKLLFEYLVMTFFLPAEPLHRCNSGLVFCLIAIENCIVSDTHITLFAICKIQIILKMLHPK